MNTLLMAIFAGMLTGATAVRAADHPSISVELVAARPSWASKEYFGHSFLLISLPTASGIKEECFGFYPKNGIGLICGPGAVVSEFDHNPSRFPRITVSIKKSISTEQRRQLYQLMKDWNTHSYQLTDQNCIDFVVAAATIVGWHAPPRGKAELPESYLKRLKDANR